MEVLLIVSTRLNHSLLILMWMSFRVSARTGERVDVIAAAVFVFASVINRRRVDAGGTPRKANGAPQLQEQFEREDKSVLHVAVNSILLMVAMDPFSQC